MLFREVIKKLLPQIEITEFNGLTIDSRKLEKGDIFLALKGEKTDGHNFILEAENAGAALVISERFQEVSIPIYEVNSTQQFLMDLAGEYRNNLSYPLIGITGSNGKTTTKDLLYYVLSSNMKIMRTEGNFNSTTGVPLSLFEFDPKADFAIIEMGASKPGEIETICKIAKPDMGIITNIGETHLEFFGDIEEVAKTKLALFTSLPTTGTAFINLDDPFISNMQLYCNRVDYSFTTPADYQAQWIPEKEEKILAVNHETINLSAHSGTMGINVLAVYCIAAHLGLDSEVIIKQIESFQLPEGRGDLMKIQNITVINDSYNSNLDSARYGIQKLMSVPSPGRKIAVIGDMLELGDLDQEHHQLLGKVLSLNEVDAVFAFGQLTQHTINAMNGSSVYHQYYDDKTALLTDLKGFIKAGDVVLIKGSRGMKMEDILTGLQS